MKGEQQDLRAREARESTKKSPLPSVSKQLKFRLSQCHSRIPDHGQPRYLCNSHSRSLSHRVPATALADPFLRRFSALPPLVSDVRRHVEGSEKCQSGLREGDGISWLSNKVSRQRTRQQPTQ